MLQMDEGKLIEEVWRYPLFKALARRRASRFGLGYEKKDAGLPYKSEKTPVPLSELETALLCWAGHGVNGIVLHDEDLSDVTVVNLMSWSGRTYPSPINNRHVELLVINDEGMFFYRPNDASKLQEMETPADRRKLSSTFRQAKVQYSDVRPHFPKETYTHSNIWHANKPGASTFVPISDVTEEYISVLLLLFGEPATSRLQVFDERTGQPAGVKKWIDNGFLKGPKVTTQYLEEEAAKAAAGINSFMCQNIALAATAMGLGYLTWSGFVRLIFLGGTPLTRGLGFRFITGKDGMPTPVGIDGFLEAWCPPYFKGMSAAVDDIMNVRYGPQGLFTPGYPGKRPFLDTERVISTYPKVSEEAIECVKDVCNYIYETYGRFPPRVDAWAAPVVVTVHHLDLDFYDKYYPREVISREKREHMQLWHQGK